MRESLYKIFSDGACTGNPGRGGWGAIIIFPDGTQKELFGGYAHTTNNRMELRAVIESLSIIPEGAQVEITTDSQYVVNAVVKKWIISWQHNNWKNAQRKPVANRDLWEKLIVLLNSHTCRFMWVRGHMGHKENERCDTLAMQAYNMPGLLDDEGYHSGLF